MADAGMKASRLWGGRFSKRTDPLVERYTSSIAVDHRLAWYDVLGSIAHASMLGRCRIIPPADSRKLVAGLLRILRDIASGRWMPDPRAEDVHSQIHATLLKRVGPAARKLHTARSRNDQVCLDLRLYCRDAAQGLVQDVRDVQRALVACAEANRTAVIPGYTHLQRAQPVLLAYHLLAYVEMLARDGERLLETRARLNVLPLGVAALAGTSLPIDRRMVAKQLGFPRIAENGMDAVSDRDFVAELLFGLAMLAVHLSRLAEDLILWTTEEFGILALDEAFATGSSLMPQKKNPDVLELVRGQAGLLIGDLTASLALLKGLPLSYNRDLQWDKTILFRAVDASHEALAVLARLLHHVRVRTDRLPRLLASDALCATDLAEWLVTEGIAFAEAHELVGRVVALAEHEGKSLRGLSLAQLRRISPHFTTAAQARLDPVRSVEHKRSLGSTSPSEVRRALARWRRRLARR